MENISAHADRYLLFFLFFCSIHKPEESSNLINVFENENMALMPLICSVLFSSSVYTVQARVVEILCVIIIIC